MRQNVNQIASLESCMSGVYLLNYFRDAVDRITVSNRFSLLGTQDESACCNRSSQVSFSTCSRLGVTLESVTSPLLVRGGVPSLETVMPICSCSGEGQSSCWLWPGPKHADQIQVQCRNSVKELGTVRNPQGRRRGDSVGGVGKQRRDIQMRRGFSWSPGFLVGFPLLLWSRARRV